MAHETAVRLEHISKSFGTVKANDDVNLEVKKGEILALLGENGSGKTTLMNMLSGIYYPDSGSIYVEDKPVSITSPKDAFAYHIGMIHQHFKLIEVFNSIENIVLGIKPTASSWTKTKYFFSNLFKSKDEKSQKPVDKASQKDARKIVANICQKYGFKVDPDKKVYDMSVSERQTLEIVKAIYRGADILILDEPTAVLTPIETEELFAVMRNMKKDGKSIIIITHKLNEVMEISDRVAVLRKGKCIGSIVTKDATESKLTEMMVGEKIELNIKRDDPVNPMPRLIVSNLSCKNREGREILHNVSFTANSGEILGIAGISGSGQKEMLECIAGLIKESNGELTYNDPDNGNKVNLRDKTAAQIRDLGVRLAFVPEDRLGMGLVGSMDLVDNMMLRSYKSGKNPFFVDRKKPDALANDVVTKLDVSTPSIHTSVRKLSGGNVQKVLVGREIASSPRVLMVAYPTRGLDINSSYLIYDLLNEQKKKGSAVIYVGEDLDVLIALSDRIAVLCDGDISGIVDARTTDKNTIGALMTKKTNEEAK
ncbi:MAG: ABC transporter ATP-binding protein [Eubacteriales bacterium]|nr:ABC transporter ATP-binding protein [Eubacteriales bacterium]